MTFGVRSQHLTFENDAGGSNLYYLSLGSNLGDRVVNITQAIDFLQENGDIREISPLYETEPEGMESSTGNFYNLVMSIRIIPSLSPLDLLSKIKEFELRMGRDIGHSHNLPRIIDIDILLVDDRLINTENLVVPHKKMTKRAFVLVPLNDIAPDLVHPVLKKSIKVIMENFPDKEKIYKVKKISPIISESGDFKSDR